MKSFILPSRHYLVTGGCGFIGSHLVTALIAQGHEVTILDNLSTGKRENAYPEAHLIVGDTTDYTTVEKAMEGKDGCFHLAAVASVEKSTIEWADSHRVNITSTVNIFQAASRMQTSIPVVYTSSAAVYGDCPVTPIPENVVPKPLTAYGVDKLACDLHGYIARHVHGIPTMGLRPFNVYGPGQDPSSPYSGVISIFTDRMLKGLPITIYGDGMQVRDFVYVADAVKAFLAAMGSLEADRNQKHRVVNLCTGRPTTIAGLAMTIARIINRPLDSRRGEARKGDIRVSIGDPARLEQVLGLKLETSLEDGLRRMMSAFGVATTVVVAQAA